MGCRRHVGFFFFYAVLIFFFILNVWVKQRLVNLLNVKQVEQPIEDLGIKLFLFSLLTICLYKMSKQKQQSSVWFISSHQTISTAIDCFLFFSLSRSITMQVIVQIFSCNISKNDNIYVELVTYLCLLPLHQNKAPSIK